MRQLRNQQLGHAKPHGVFGTRERHDNFSARDTCDGAAHHGRRTDFLKTEHAEQLPEAVQTFVEYPIDGFVSAVPRGDAGAAGRNHHLDIAVGELIEHHAFDLRRFIADDSVSGDEMAGGGE